MVRWPRVGPEILVLSRGHPSRYVVSAWNVRPSLGHLANEDKEGLFMPFCPIRRSSGQFNSVLESFVQGAGLPLRDALGEDLIERVAQPDAECFVAPAEVG